MRQDVKLLEFMKVKSIIKRFIQTRYGIEALNNISPIYDIEYAKQQTYITNSFFEYFHKYAIMTLDDIYISQILRDSFYDILKPNEFIEIARFLDMLSYIRENMINNDIGFYDTFVHLHLLEDLKHKIYSCIDGYGYVLDTASLKLSEIRKKIKSLKNEILGTLRGMLNSNFKHIVIDNNVFLKRFRYTVLLKPNFKEYISGRIVDISKSNGMFVEPSATYEKNNELEHLSIDEEKEVKKILYGITHMVRKYANDLKEDINLIAFLDLHIAKFRYAIHFNATMASFDEKYNVYARNVKHSILLDIKKDKTVGNDIMLKETNNLIVTGPNTGGKTVFIKTVGLIVMCAYCAIPVTADECIIGNISNIYVIVGDEQNIEESLSGFSSKVNKINKFVENLDKNSLILIDEIGSGTSPEEGEAIAYAIVHYLRDKGCTFVITTHYKRLAYILQKDGFNMASFEFDDESLMPAYQLKYNKIGKSYGVSVLKLLKTPEMIVKKAEWFLKNRDTIFNKLTENMGAVLNELNLRIVALDAKKNEYESLIKEQEHLNLITKEKIDKEFYVKKRDFDTLLELLKNTLKDMMKYKNISSAHQQLSKINKIAGEVFQENENRFVSNNLNIGDFVDFNGKSAKVIQIKSTHAKIEVENGILNVPLVFLKKIEGSRRNWNKKSNIIMPNNGELFELNIIGKLKEEAQMELLRFLDFTSSQSFSRIRIIHGKGSGVLKNMVRDELKNYPFVKTFYMAPPNEGGDGATIVELK